jgi:hypothetical protein
MKKKKKEKIGTKKADHGDRFRCSIPASSPVMDDVPFT